MGASRKKKSFSFVCYEGLTRLGSKAGEGKEVFQASTKLSMGKAMASLHRAISCGLYFYFMDKPPAEEEFGRWFTKLYGEKVTL